jgi:hypothetical protein
MCEVDGESMNFNSVITRVGDEQRTVDADIFFGTFEELVDFYGGTGLRGAALDIAVRDALPSRLLERVGDAGKPN